MGGANNTMIINQMSQTKNCHYTIVSTVPEDESHEPSGGVFGFLKRNVKAEPKKEENDIIFICCQLLYLLSIIVFIYIISTILLFLCMHSFFL
jgi:hypothetical protein